MSWRTACADRLQRLSLPRPAFRRGLRQARTTSPPRSPKLADLRDKGAITPADYEAKKAELLGRL